MRRRPRAALPPAGERTVALVLAVLLLAVAAQLPAWWGWLADPAHRILDNPFTGGHLWAADVVSDALWSGHWPDPIDQAGFPTERSARFVGWAFLAAAAVLRPLFTATAVVHLAALLGPALGGVGLVLLARALSPPDQPPTRPALQLLAGLLFALSPVTLGAALSGQVENTQTWVLTGLLLVTWQAMRRAGAPLRLSTLWLPLLWCLGALTSPYLAMFAVLLTPWLAWRARREGASMAASLSPLLLAGLGLLAAQSYLSVGSFSPESVLYRPSFSADGWPPLWVLPLPVAGLDTLLLGLTEPQVKATVIHQPYLGLVLVLSALVLGRQRRTNAIPVALGVLLALGPRLALGGAAVTVAGRELLLPAILVQWLHLPLAHGGQYYRAVVLAHLGLALMLAQGRAPGASPSGRLTAGLAVVLGLVGTADALRSVSTFGLPWPTVQLPTEAWQQLAADPVPGAVLNLPMQSTQLRPNHPVRLAGHVYHRRAVSDMPRAWTEAPEDALMSTVWRASLVTPKARLPARSDLGERGFRYVVLDLPAIPERRSLLARLESAWGPADGRVDGLAWWVME